MTKDPFWLRYLPEFIREKLTGRINLFAIIHNSGWLLFDKMVRLLLGLLVGAWVARYLGPTQYGELAYVLAYIAFFQAVALLGMDGIVVRDIARDKEQAGLILGTAFTMKLIAGVACWLTAIGGMVLMKGWHDQSVMITALAGGSLVFQAADTIDLWFQSQSQSKRTVAAKLICHLLSSAIKIILILNNSPLLYFAAVMSFDVAASAAGLVIAYGRFSCKQQWKFIFRRGKELVLETWPFLMAGLINMLQARIEFFIIQRYLGVESVGQYAAALRFIELFDIIGVVIALSIFPKLASNKKADKTPVIRRIYFGVILLYIFIIPGMIALWLLFGVLYGEQYSVAQGLYLLMMYRPFFTYIGLARGMVIKIDGRNKYALFCSFVGAITAASLGLVLIDVYGLKGAILTSFVSYFVSNIFIDVFFYKSNFKNLIGCYNS